jgi:hypothetical protein
MKKTMSFLVAMTAAFALAMPAFAADPCCPAGAAARTSGPALAAASAPPPGANPHAGMDMGDQSGKLKIHQGKKDGYSFAFELLPMKGEGYTHHLMVFVKDASGKAVNGAKVGYDVVSPVSAKKKDQKVMAMGMGDGYGANLDFSAKGKYTIKTKVVGGGPNLLYDFVYEVK